MAHDTATSAATNKDERFNIRAKRDEKALVDQAARVARMSTSQFVMQAALRSAEEVLADQTRFVLPPDQWDAFAAAIDRPARVIPKLKKAADRPSVLSER